MKISQWANQAIINLKLVFYACQHEMHKLIFKFWLAGMPEGLQHIPKLVTNLITNLLLKDAQIPKRLFVLVYNLQYRKLKGYSHEI
jgi:hypothetical protein